MSCTVKELLNYAEYNRDHASVQIQLDLAEAQERQHDELISAGASEDDNINEALEKYPECHLKL